MIQGLELITDSTELTPENSHFSLSPYGLLTAKIPGREYEGRVFLALAFPFQTETEYICVFNEEKEELGMIRDLAAFDEETAALIASEIKKKYFAPVIRKIIKMSERNGITYWDCETDHGALSFTVRDVHRSLIRITEDSLFVVDIDGCRYRIESVEALDRKSHSKIELYL